MGGNSTGYHGGHSRVAFIIVAALVFTLVVGGVLIAPIGSRMPEPPERVPEPPTPKPIIPETEPEPSSESVFSIVPPGIVVHVGDTFAVRVLALNVTDMFGWQIALRFDPARLECLNVSVPDQHVFVTGYPVSRLLMDFNSTQFPERPLQVVDNEEGSVLAGDSLLNGVPTFNGSGVLCQVSFKALSSGVSSLELVVYDEQGIARTVILNPEIDVTVPTVVNGQVTVHSTRD
jgi:hypothetical protein